MITATHQQIVLTFTEWERRYREEPEKFMNAVQRLLGETADTYGAMAAPYFCVILAEVQGAKADE